MLFARGRIKQSSYFFLVGLSSLLACQGQTESQKNSRIIDEKWSARLGKIENVRMDLYGKVVDQYGNPVEGAEVSINLNRFSRNTMGRESRDIQVKSDAEGRFKISNEKGMNLHIKTINKKGYDFSQSYDQWINKTFRYSGGKYQNEEYYIPNPGQPEIYRGRKMGEQTFLIKHQLNFPFKAKEFNFEKGMDLIVGWNIKPEEMRTLVLNGDPLVCDLKAKATFDNKKRAWSVVLTANSPGGGVLVSDQLLYEAPQEGYLPSYTFTQGKENPIKARYIYIRSRQPFIYTRMDLGDQFNVNSWPFINMGEKGDWNFHIGGKTATNPYGERNLEESPELTAGVRKILEDEVHAAFRRGTRPSKPDLMKLIKQEEKDKEKPLLKKMFGK